MSLRSRYWPPHHWSVGEAFTHVRDTLQLAWLIAAGAADEALRQAERTREETARRRANEERPHIGRELHDSLSHQSSVIKVQAEVAVHPAAGGVNRFRRPCWRSGRRW